MEYLHVTGTRSLLLLQQIQTSQYSEYNVRECLSPCSKKNKQCTNPQLWSEQCPLKPIRLCRRGWHCTPGTQPRASSTVEHCPCHSFFFCSTPGTKAALPSCQGAELGHCPQALWSTYHKLSLRVAMAVCRASSFTASQPGGEPFWSSSFTASTAPSIVPTAALYCSSEGGWQALLATGCRFKQTWNINLILYLRDQSSSKCKKPLRWNRAARVPCPVRVLAAGQALQTIKISYKGPGVHETFLLRTWRAARPAQPSQRLPRTDRN